MRLIHYCKNCNQPYERYSIPQMVLVVMEKIEMLDSFHIRLCSKCLKDQIRYCTSDSELPDPSLMGQPQ